MRRDKASDLKSTKANIVISAIVFAILALFTVPQGGGAAVVVARLVYCGFVSAIAYFIFSTGRISRYRSVFFIVAAAGFIVTFKSELFALTASLFKAKDAVEVPYCHISMVSNIFNLLHDQWVAFRSGSYREWGFYSFGVIWLVATLSTGQGWCSWVCFYGGIDEGFSKILKKRSWRLLS